MPDPLCIVLLTYAASADSDRAKYAQRTLESVLLKSAYSGKLILHIADDGSPSEHIDNLHNLARGIVPDIQITSSNAERRGYGASFNLATQTTHQLAHYQLMLEDDWELHHNLYLDSLTKALDEGLNCIRLGYLGWTQELRGKVAKYADQSFLLFDPDCAEPHVWAGHPRLETTEFQRSVGFWEEGVDPGTTEFLTALRPEARQNVGWPLDLGAYASQHYQSLFVHIGTTQARDDQRESASLPSI